jgi:multiple sugar transport system permease protein
LIWPVTSLVLILQLILQFKIFDQVYLLTNGGPSNSTTVVLLYMYRQAFNQNRGGYASAVAMALVVIIVVVSFVQARLLRVRSVK